MKVGGVKVGHLTLRVPASGLYAAPRGWARINAPDIGAVIWYCWQWVGETVYAEAVSVMYAELDAPRFGGRDLAAWRLREVRAIFKIRLRRLKRETERANERVRQSLP